MSKRRSCEQIWKSRDGWRWRVVASNGNIIAESGEAYASKRNAKRALESVRRHFAGSPRPTRKRRSGAGDTR